MKKLLVHTEYLCILNLIGLVPLMLFYDNGQMMFWALLVFLDVAELLLRIDETKVVDALFQPQFKTQTQRIKVYLLGLLILYVYILITRSWVLLLILLINDALSSLLSWVFQTYVFKDEHIDSE